MTRRQTLRLFLSTVRYLQPSQVFHRARFMARRYLRRATRRRAPLPRRVPHPQILPPLYAGLPQIAEAVRDRASLAALIERARARADRMSHGQISVFGKKVPLRDASWHDHALTQLERYQLHYFNFVDDLFLQAAGHDRATSVETFKTIVRSWIDQNERRTGDGWHPYTVSLRIINWLKAMTVFHTEIAADEEFFDLLCRSLYGQAAYLRSNLELDVRGNHLFENCRALIWAGLAFPGQPWFVNAIERLKFELREQISDGGGHFERAPGYHLTILRELIELVVLLDRAGAEPSVISPLRESVRQMSDFLLAITKPDGTLPLLKDSVESDPPPEILNAAAILLQDGAYKPERESVYYAALLFGESGLQQLGSFAPAEAGDRIESRSGFYVVKESGDYLIVDAGEVCPSYLPAHAHADMFSYELMLRGRSIVVDSGVYEYAAGPWRDYFRSTRAHNTLEVAQSDQSEVWSSFRVGRRATPTIVRWTYDSDAVLLIAQHDGYRRLRTPVTHRRSVVWLRHARSLAVIDDVLGNDVVDTTSYVHFDPAIVLENADARTWSMKNEPFHLVAAGHDSGALERGVAQPRLQGWTSRRFGDRGPNTVLALHARRQAPFRMGYVISDAFASVELSNDSIRIAAGDQTYSVSLPLTGEAS